MYTEPTKTKQTIKWEGHYMKEGKKLPLEFKDMHISHLGQIQGSGSDKDGGKFDLHGFLSSDGIITFQKLYKKKELAGPIYKGRFHNRYLAGSWAIGGVTDSFFLELQDAKKYVGCYHRGDIPIPLDAEMTLVVDKKGIFGLGKDHTGYFVVNGHKVKKHNYKFMLSYVGQFQLNHEAEIKTVKDKKTKVKNEEIEGNWTNHFQQISGTYKLTERKPQKNKKGEIIAEAEKVEEASAEEVTRYKRLHSSMFQQKIFNGLGNHTLSSGPNSDANKAQITPVLTKPPQQTLKISNPNGVPQLQRNAPPIVTVNVGPSFPVGGSVGHNPFAFGMNNGPVQYGFNPGHQNPNYNPFIGGPSGPQNPNYNPFVGPHFGGNSGNFAKRF